MPKIKVHEKVLGHLSRGLYRSPASALRELVSNAWDANATLVNINTNYPNFLQVSVDDNGDGFTVQEFTDLMEKGIGNTQKRTHRQSLINNRPIIGRLGIGMLGIAQICGAFTITSKPKHGKGFRARIRLYDLLKEQLDKNARELVKGKEDHVKEVNVGEYTFEEYDPKVARRGTVLIADDVHPTFVRAFQGSLQYEKFKEPSLNWSNAMKIVSAVHSLQELGDYWRLLWELAACCPLPYLSKDALPDALIEDDHRKLQAYDFRVVVDGIKLAKPVYLRGNPGGYTTKKIATQKPKVYGRTIKFHGYLVVQDGLQLQPDELRGILVRVKQVGIGYYDTSMLDYRYNEGPRSRWLTGEIFADEGLEDALNIDRDSFNRFHPQFRKVQEYLHDVLRNEVFPEVYRKIEIRSLKKKRLKEDARAECLQHVLSTAVDVPVKLKEESRPARKGETPHVAITQNAKVVEVTLPSLKTLQTRKPFRQLAAAVLAIYEISDREKTSEKQREVFADLLLKLLAEW